MTASAPLHDEKLPQVAVEHIDCEFAALHESSEHQMVASYALRLGSETTRIWLIDPGLLEMDSLSCSWPYKTQRGWGRGTAGEIIELLVVSLSKPAAAQEAQLTLSARWTASTRARLSGSPVLVLPAHLPAVSSGYEVFSASRLDIATPPARLPRLRVRSKRGFEGQVSAADGEPTMVALLAPDARGHDTWHADDRLVIVGDLLRGTNRDLRTALRDLLLEIHDFGSETYGRGSFVRVLALAETNAYDYTRFPGQFCALGQRLIQRTSAGRFPAARLFARDIFGLWWSHGVRPTGAFGGVLAFGLTMAGVLHWLAMTGRHADLRDEVEIAERMLSFGDQTILRKAHMTAAETAYAARVALTIHGASEKLSAHAELRRCCEEYWGLAVPAARIVFRLREIGVQVPELPFG